MEGHSLSRQALRRFLAGTSPPDERREVARHLLNGCEICRQLLRRSLSPLPPGIPVIASSYEDVFDRVEGRLAQAIAQMDEVSRLLVDLAAHPKPRQELLAGHRARYWSLPFCDLLLDRSQSAQFIDPAEMRHFARLATIVAGKLGSRQADAGQVVAYRARSWLALANALRVSGDLNNAEKMLIRTQEQLDSQRTSRVLRAELLSQMSSLRFDQRRFGEALAVSREDIAIRRDLHNPSQVAKALISHALSLGEDGHPRQALEVLDEAGTNVPASDSRMRLILQHNQIRFTLSAGDVQKAERLFAAMEPLRRDVRDPLIQIKTHWLESQILAACGHLREAAELLTTARLRFLELGNTYEAAMVGLELAGVSMKMGRKDEVRRLAAAALREFRALRIQRDYLAAVILLRQAS